ncbi:hypothetical protein [Qipengyuania sp.]|uniref:hypothetical protein n=1 Tax=Qipengyuania sp. TaxID=2004515 RepID=UPI003514322F
MMLPERPLRLLPRWAAVLLLLLTAVACVWSAPAITHRHVQHEADIAKRTKLGERPDMDLYSTIDARVAAGEDYYEVAAELQRERGFPTSPFVTVRTPVLAWTTALWGAQGWRLIAVLLWAANILAWFTVLRERVGRPERYAAAALAGYFGMLTFFEKIAFSHEALAGLMLSLALALSFRKAWWAALALAGFAIALRELALPFLLAWGAVALLAGDRKRLAGIVGAIALIAAGLALHAGAVAAVRLPGDLHSEGWHGMLGLSLPFYGIDVTTLLVLLPHWIAGPLIVLALLGWLSLGGRLGAFASLWFAGFIAAAAIFARLENFYWMGLFVPAYGVGLAFVPRAASDLAAALRRPAAPGPRPGSPR